MIFSEKEWIAWVIAMIIFLLLELATADLTTIWFLVGSIFACMASLFGANFIVQIAIFLITSIVLIFTTKPIAEKYFNNKIKQGGYHQLIGEMCCVSEDIDSLNNTGRVDTKFGDWKAKASDLQTYIKTGSIVEIIGVEGVSLVVKPVIETDNSEQQNEANKKKGE